MTEYFMPKKIWIGKLLYLKLRYLPLDQPVFVACRVIDIRPDKRIAEVVTLAGDRSCFWEKYEDIFDCIEGPTIFYETKKK